MPYPRVVSIAVLSLMGLATANAQDHSAMDHQKHMAMMMTEDNRQLVAFPPPMREHTLANMRDHMQALSDILTAMATAQYGEASRIADARLGMGSPAAEGCKSDGAGAAQMSMPASMEHQMSEIMPEGMRTIGLEMHQAASAFATEAAKASKTGEAKSALVALSRVTRQCSACHTAYRVQ